jgi:hypothetical protein
MAEPSATNTAIAVVIRAFVGAVLTGAAMFLTTLQSVDDDCGARTPPATVNCEPGDMSAEDKALFAALAAGISYLIARGGFEGGVDITRQKTNKVWPGDVADAK